MRPEAGPAGAGNQSWSAHAQLEIGDDHAPKLHTHHRARPRPRVARRRGHQRPPADPSVEATAPQGSPSQTGALTAEAWFDRANATYALGETVQLFVRTNEDAYVTALSIGPTGNVTQIFPNAFHPNNLVQAHQPIGIPGHGAHAVVTGALGPEMVKIIVTTRPVQVIPEDQLGAAAPFRSVLGGVDAVARDLKTVAAQPELDLVVLDKKFLSVPPAPAPTYFTIGRAARSTATPRRSTATPRRSTATPRRSTATPRRSTATPRRSTATPRRRTATPRRRTATPRQSTATPRQRTAMAHRRPRLRTSIPSPRIPSRRSGFDRRLRSPGAPAFRRSPNSTTRIRSQLPAMAIWSR